MSSDESESGPLSRAYNALSPEYAPHPDPEMDVIGWGIFLGILFLIMPLLPLLVVVWFVTKLLDVIAPRGA